jgi:hypothetical protein
MDIVIALGTGSRWMDNELRYALRSIEKHLKGHTGRILLIGQKPKWVKNVDYYDIPDVPGRKNFSIFQKILTGCEMTNTEDFIFWNDDHFLLKDLHVNQFRYWYDGLCKQWAEKATGLYKRAITNTANLPGCNDLYTDIHVPIVYNAKKFGKLLDLDWKQEYVIKSAYTKNMEGGFEYMADLKLNQQYNISTWMGKLHNRLFFSIGSYAVNADFKIMMEKRYPRKSQYEK